MTGLTQDQAVRLVDKVNSRPRDIGSHVIACGLGIDVRQFWRVPSRHLPGAIEWQFPGFRLRETKAGSPRMVMLMDGGRSC